MDKGDRQTAKHGADTDRSASRTTHRLPDESYQPGPASETKTARNKGF
jgi:hypothetical protein